MSVSFLGVGRRPHTPDLGARIEAGILWHLASSPDAWTTAPRCPEHGRRDCRPCSDEIHASRSARRQEIKP